MIIPRFYLNLQLIRFINDAGTLPYEVNPQCFLSLLKKVETTSLYVLLIIEQWLKIISSGSCLN